MSNERERRTVRLRVKATLLESKDAEKIPKVVAYAFSSGGHLVALGRPIKRLHWFCNDINQG